jgi:hypothetical protein
MTSYHTRDHQRESAAGTRGTHRYHTRPAGLMFIQTPTPYMPQTPPSVAQRSDRRCASELYGDSGSVAQSGPLADS